MTPNRLRLWTALIIAFVLFLLLRFGVTMYTDWLWFQTLDFESVYLTSLLGRVVVFFVAAIPFVVILLGNLILARWFSTRGELFLGQRRVLDLPIFGWLILVTALFLGLAVGLAASPRWLDFLRFFNQVPFDVRDPIFDRDVGFYVFSLPVYQFIQGWLLTTLLMALIGVIIIGPGLPRVSFEQELMRQYYAERYGMGFEYAYLFVGLTRVIQSAGRLIRSEHDTGVAVLVGQRFATPRYAELFPSDWYEASPAELISRDIPGDLAAFWSGIEVEQYLCRDEW